MELRRYSRLSAALPRLLARLSPWPDAVLVNSEAGRAAHERLGYRPRRWELIPNGIEIDRFRPDPVARGRLRAELGLATDAFVISLPARFDPMKDHATFLAAAQHFAERHREARFLLVGRGNDGANPTLCNILHKIACAAQILLLGERHDMPAIFAASDAVTLSSRFGEGFPNVLAEAMACGVPVVTTDVGDAARLVAGAGSVVPIGDAAAIAAAWEALAALGAEGRAEQGERARRRIANSYALPAIVARYEAFYAELTADEPRHASRLLDGRAGR
jgi:glycosyltransferase involved in cell wall biosynthesis